MSRRVSQILSGVIVLGTSYARSWRRAHLRLLVSEHLHQRHRVNTRHGSLTFVSTHARALETPRNFHAAEPETLEWIDGFAPGSVFWDIGANVGAYSLYAGKRGDIEVLAFEPSSSSYAALCTNIAENRLDRVHAFCIALGERSRLGILNMSRSYPGSVYNAFEQEVDMTGKQLSIERKQGAVGIAADDLIEFFGATTPNYIKLDVDSTEVLILRGAARLLRSTSLLSLVVEHAVEDTPQNHAIASLLAAAGFRASGRGLGGGDLTVNMVYRR